jgi:hypothetical protein
MIMQLMKIRDQLFREKLLIRLGLRFFVGASLLFVSIRDYILGNGLYLNRDWSWPLSSFATTSTDSFAPNILRNSYADPIGFTSVFVTWPYEIIRRIFPGPFELEKVYIIYLFSFLIFLGLAFSQLLVKAISRTGKKGLSLAKREFLVFSALILCFANPWTVNALASFYFQWVANFFLFGISTMLIFMYEQRLATFFVTGAVMSFTVLLDPDQLPFGLFFLLIYLICSTLVRKWDSWRSALKSFIPRVIIVLAFTLPAVFIVLYSLNTSFGTTLIHSNSAASVSSNLSILNSLRELGYYDASIAFSSPSIVSAGTHISSLAVAGYPPFAVLPAGFLTSTWLLDTWALPIAAFASLPLRDFKRLTVPAAICAFVTILFTSNVIPNLTGISSNLQIVPVLGDAIFTALSIPEHMYVIITLSYVIMILVLLWKMFEVFDEGGFQRFSGLRSRGFFNPLIALTLIILVFPGWQFFSGSFYPAGYSSSLGNNGIPSVGAFTPVRPPSDLTYVYNGIASQNGSFNVYWPGPASQLEPWNPKASILSTEVDPPKPSFLVVYGTSGLAPGLNYLLLQNLTDDLAAYLSAMDIRYLIIQGPDLASWAVPRSSLFEELGNASGLQEVFTDQNISVFEDNSTWGSYYYPGITLSYPAPDSAYATAYQVLSSMGVYVAIVSGNSPLEQLCLDTYTPSCGVTVLAPHDLSSQNSKSRIISDSSTPFDQSFQTYPAISYDFGNFSGYIYVDYMGHGDIQLSGKTNQTLNVTSLSDFRWTNFTSPSENSSLKIQGTLNIAAVVASKNPLSGFGCYNSINVNSFDCNGNLVFSNYYVPDYYLASTAYSYRAQETIGGTDLFSNVRPGNYTVGLRSLRMIQGLYLTTISIDYVAIGAGAWLLLKRRVGD